MCHYTRLPIPGPSIALGGIPLEAWARAIKSVVFVRGDPALHEQLVEDHEQMFGRARWTTGDRFGLGVGAGVSLTRVDYLDRDPLHRDHVLDYSLSAVKTHCIRCHKRDRVGGVEPVELLTELTRIPLGTLGPQSAAGGEERTNLALDEVVGVPSDPKTTIIACWDLHFPILALSRLGSAEAAALISGGLGRPA